MRIKFILISITCLIPCKAPFAASLDSDFFSEQEDSSEISIDTIPSHSRDTSEKLIEVYVGPDPNEMMKHRMSRYTPRIIKYKNSLFYNDNYGFMPPKAVQGRIKTNSIITKNNLFLRYQYLYTGWQKTGHFIFDIYKNELVYHRSNLVSHQFKVNTVNRSVDDLYFGQFFIDQNKDTLIVQIPEKLKNRNGYLTTVFINRQKVDSSMSGRPILTTDSSEINEILEEMWFDFHIDKKGRSHAFVYIRGELVYLQQKKASQDPDINTWKEIFSVPTTDDIGPFTSVTVKGKQYLFTQDGTILKNTGKSMIEVGKLPGDLRNTSVVWDKEKDKMWYITKEEFKAYKAGDASILQQMHEIPISKR